jgi:hypothetical protein
MFASMRIAAIEVAACHNAFTPGQMNSALRATHHIFRWSRSILFGRLFAIRLQQQIDDNHNGQQKKQATHASYSHKAAQLRLKNWSG